MRPKKSNNTSNELPQNDFWVSVSDLMAGLIFLFIIIMTVFSYKFSSERNHLIEVKSQLQNPALTRKQILIDLKILLEKLNVEIVLQPEEGILRLKENTLKFPPARAFPEQESLPNIGKLAAALTAILPCNSNSLSTQTNDLAEARPLWCGDLYESENLQCHTHFKSKIETVMIEGHTDASIIRAGNGYKDNLSLSAARAATVLRLLKKCDPRLGQLFNSQNQPLIGVSGYSYMRPIKNKNPLNPDNRRIDVRFVMELPRVALNEENKNQQPAAQPPVTPISKPLNKTVIPVKITR